MRRKKISHDQINQNQGLHLIYIANICILTSPKQHQIKEKIFVQENISKQASSILENPEFL